MIIGITGAARAGKDTVADIIIGHHQQFGKASFADPLKSMLSIGLGLTSEQLYGDEKHIIDERYGCSPRHMMQTLGTEWGRYRITSEIWVKAMIANNYENVIIPDVRFPNEADYIRERGLLIHVKGRGGIDGGHVSEDALDVAIGDVVVNNSGSMLDLQKTMSIMTHEGTFA